MTVPANAPLAMSEMDCSTSSRASLDSSISARADPIGPSTSAVTSTASNRTPMPNGLEPAWDLMSMTGRPFVVFRSLATMNDKARAT